MKVIDMPAYRLRIDTDRHPNLCRLTADLERRERRAFTRGALQGAVAVLLAAAFALWRCSR